MGNWRINLRFKHKKICIGCNIYLLFQTNGSIFGKAKIRSLSKIAANKRKIINDPVYGFISFPYESNFDLIEHPYFQRLRRIRQLGLTNFVYPGANHTRFQHALGAGYLMTQAIQVIRSKEHEITEEEAEAAINAILLHDMGHGPFSHSLENSIIEGITHEELSLLFMHQLNEEFNGQLTMSIDIFVNRYPKKFLHQLVAGQLDMDRLDYLKRDSFFTGVTEGVIGSDRIIKMLNIKDDNLVVDIKGIYSIEKFLVARRLMYWQVYLHKAVVSAEKLLIMILKRAKEISLRGENLFASPALSYFLKNTSVVENFKAGNSGKLLELFSQLDDTDIISASKQWMHHDDRILSFLCNAFINRRLFRLELRNKPFEAEVVAGLRGKLHQIFSFSEEESGYFVHAGELSNEAYNTMDERISIMKKNGETMDITEASDIFDLAALSKKVKKYYLTYPKDLE
ncbi:MAG: HD domain-containing protein [Bacteroidales bacterium]|nr:HD domain-containing protein [Bacteroidales bacterium]